MTDNQNKETTCCFSGHREFEFSDELKNILDGEIIRLVRIGVSNFICGMARGFDLAAAESVLEIKKRNPELKLVCAVPCPGQTDSFPEEDKRRHAKIQAAADEVILISSEYSIDCMHRRNRFMVDRSAYVICWLEERTGGTAYTVKYAKKRGVQVINLAERQIQLF